VYDGTFRKTQYDVLEKKSFAKLTEESQKLFIETAIVLSARKVDMLRWNKEKLKELNQPIANLRAVHSKRGLEQIPSNKTGGLCKDVWICKGARVVLTENLWTEEKLVNGSIGTIVGILYWGNDKPPTLPIVLCTFKDYTGPSFLPGVPKCVPIPEKTYNFFHSGKPVSRTMIPLLLGWGITIHKSQGMTMDKTIIKLGPTEFASGLTYTAMSRNKAIDDMCLKPFPCMDRFLNVFNGKNFKMRKHYEIFPIKYVQKTIHTWKRFQTHVINCLIA
jgi:ATP-dependent DNA helicase PIF1